jgi:hypothetical protein
MNSSLAEVIDRWIDKGMTFSFESNDLCCPDCLQTTYLPVVPSSPMITTHEVNDNNYRIYLLASVETSLKYFEGAGLTESAPVPASPLTAVDPNPKLNCCLHYEASVETSLKLTNGTGGYDGIGNDIPNNLKSCSTNFNSCISDLFNTFTPEEIDRILDKGIVEYGSISGQSQVCLLKTLVDLAYNSQPRISASRQEILDRLLDKGFVISCYNGEMSISSVETFLNWYNDYILGPAPVPALNNKNNI